MNGALREVFRQHIRSARLSLYEAAIDDRYRAIARGDYASLEESLAEDPIEPPYEPTEQDIDLVEASWWREAELVREAAREHEGVWDPVVVARWYARAAEIEHRLTEPGAAPLVRTMLWANLEALRASRGHR